VNASADGPGCSWHGSRLSQEIQAMVDYCSAAGLAVFPTVAAAAAAVQKARSYYAGQPAYRR